MFKFYLWSVIFYNVLESVGRGLKSVAAHYINYVCSQKLHKAMIVKVIRAPINLYYDLTPVGTIMNRFTNDLGEVESTMGE